MPGNPASDVEVGRAGLINVEFVLRTSNLGINVGASLFADIDGDADTTLDQHRIWSGSSLSSNRVISVDAAMIDLDKGESLTEADYFILVDAFAGNLEKTILHPMAVSVASSSDFFERPSNGNDEIHDIAYLNPDDPQSDRIVCGQFTENLALPASGGGQAITLTGEGGNDGFLARLDSNGDAVWLVRIASADDDQVLHLAVTSDTVFLAGIYDATLTLESQDGAEQELAFAHEREAFWAAYDLDGNLNWSKSAIGPGVQQPYDIRPLQDGSVAIVGLFQDSATLTGANEALDPPDGGLSGVAASSGFIAVYDSNGDHRWSTFAASLNEDHIVVATSTCVLRNGSLIVAGRFEDRMFFQGESSSIESNGAGDLWLAGFSPEGQLLWRRGEGGPGNERRVALTTVGAGSGFSLAGGFSETFTLGGSSSIELSSTDADVDLFLADYSSDGFATRATTWDSLGGDILVADLIPSRAGGYLIVSEWSGILSIDLGASPVPLESRGAADGLVLDVSAEMSPAGYVVLTGTATERIRRCAERSDRSLSIVGGYNSNAFTASSNADGGRFDLNHSDGEELFWAVLNPDLSR